VWKAYTGVIHCVFEQIPKLVQNCFTTPGSLRQINTCRQVPLQEKPTFRGCCLYSYLVHVLYITTLAYGASIFSSEANPWQNTFPARWGGGQSTTPNNVLINMYNKHTIKKYYNHAMDKITSSSIQCRYQSIPCLPLK
jgi:hypothetical protein